METKGLLLVALIAGLAIAVIILGIRSMTHAERETAAAQMSAVLIDHLRGREYNLAYSSCRTLAPGRYEQIEACLKEAQESKDLTRLFAEERFQNVDERQHKEGFLVIENKLGGQTFESAKFTLIVNNQEVAKGCATPGEIAPGYSCRFEFNTTCQPGDNLEILYNGNRAYLKTC